MILARAALLVIAGAIAGITVNSIRGNGVPLFHYQAPTQCTGEGGEATEVDPAHVASLCGRSDVIVADARPAARYAEGHIAGAVHLPCDADGRSLSDALGRFSGASMIVVYGEGTEDARAVAASLLRRNPHGARVAILRGGFAAWSAGARACESGPCEECSTGGSSR